MPELKKLDPTQSRKVAVRLIKTSVELAKSSGVVDTIMDELGVEDALDRKAAKAHLNDLMRRLDMLVAWDDKQNELADELRRKRAPGLTLVK